jgi:hypothetical protein
MFSHYRKSKPDHHGETRLEQFAACFAELDGMSIDQAMRHVRSSLTRWGAAKCEMAETALIDLASRLLGIPALEFPLLHPGKRLECRKRTGPAFEASRIPDPFESKAVRGY